MKTASGKDRVSRVTWSFLPFVIDVINLSMTKFTWNVYVYNLVVLFAVICFQTQKPFEIAVQTTGDTWHFPSRDGNHWLCAKKAVS